MSFSINEGVEANLKRINGDKQFRLTKYLYDRKFH